MSRIMLAVFSTRPFWRQLRCGSRYPVFMASAFSSAPRGRRTERTRNPQAARVGTINTDFEPAPEMRKSLLPFFGPVLDSPPVRP